MLMRRPFAAGNVAAIGGAGVSYEPEAIDLFARMSVQPDATRKGHINSLISELKAAGVWAKLDLLQVYAAHDQQAGNLNWLNASHTASPQSSPTFTTDRSYQGNGSSSYVDANFNPATDAAHLTQDSAFFGIWSRTVAGSSFSTAGATITGTGGITILTRTGADAGAGRINQSANFVTAGGLVTDGSGLHSIVRSGAAAIDRRRNGVSVATATNASIAVSNTPLTIGRTGTSMLQYSATEVAAVVLGSFLTTTEDGNLYTALNAYMVAVGAA